MPGSLLARFPKEQGVSSRSWRELKTILQGVYQESFGQNAGLSNHEARITALENASAPGIFPGSAAAAMPGDEGPAPPVMDSYPPGDWRNRLGITPAEVAAQVETITADRPAAAGRLSAGPDLEARVTALEAIIARLTGGAGPE